MAQGALRYAAQRGLAPPALDAGLVVACRVRTREIAAAYLAAPAFDRGALPAYRAFREETARQFDFLTRPARRGGLGVRVEIEVEDPYPDAEAMTKDLAANQRLRVYATGGSGNPHGFLADDDNDMFRAVHDAFGHAAARRGFDRHGEEAAWFKHSQMYSPVAQRAMTTETRGQTSAFVWRNDAFPGAGARFPEQKVALLPWKYCDPTSISLLHPPPSPR